MTVMRYRCRRCKQQLYCAPDGSWVNGDEDVICVHGSGAVAPLFHLLERYDDGTPESHGTVVATMDDGSAVEGFVQTGAVDDHLIALVHRAGPGMVTYLGTMVAEQVVVTDGTRQYRWHVRGRAHDLDYVDTYAGSGTELHEVVRLLYTAHELSEIEVRE